jgi:uncharacterized protein YjbI with pentapeptide repeats/DNA-binding winged helix-turn-helix (wHTH) protein/type II secretory pathway predicted ATPase ExeA
MSIEYIAYRLGRHCFRKPPPQLYDESNNIVRLPAAALTVLETLVVNRHRVVSRDELLDAAWPDCVVAPNSLDQAVAALRKHIPPEFIVVVRAHKPTNPGGYRYVGPFEEMKEAASVQPGGVPGVGVNGRYRRAWLSFARTVISSYENRNPLEYPYAVRDPDVPLRATIGEKPEYHFEAVDQIRKNLKPRTFTIVIGEYGSGKSYLAGTLAYRLAKEFVSDPDSGLLPVIVPLRQTNTLTNLDSILQSTLFTMYSVIFSPQAFVAAHQTGRLVLILDGLDEMIARTDRKDIFFHLSFLLQSALFATTPIVLTTRPNVIPNSSYYRRLGAAYTVITVDPLDDAEVRRYLRKLNLADILNAIESGPATVMGDLFSRPLYVEMIIAAADRIRERIRTAASLDALTLNQLYEFYFEYWYKSELEKMGRAPGDLELATAKSILSQVAKKMSSAHKPYIGESLLEMIVQEAIPVGQDGATLHAVFTAAKERLILVPDFADEETRFAFRHDSLRSYFYAAQIATELRAGRLTDDDVLGLDTATIDFLFAIATGDEKLGSQLSNLSAGKTAAATPTAKDVLSFLWNRKRTSLVDPAALTWLCTGDENVRSIVGRSLGGATFPAHSTFVNVTLANGTFRGSTLDHAAFQGGTLAGTDFRLADLSHCRIDRTNIDDAKFEQARLIGAQLHDVQATGVHFTDCTLPEASMHRCTFVDSDFAKSKMLGASAQGSHFVRVSFDGADLRTSHFVDCVFENCTFANALLTGAVFDESCRFERTDLGEAIRA